MLFSTPGKDCCGGRTRTGGLQIMSLTRFRLLHSAMCLLSYMNRWQSSSKFVNPVIFLKNSPLFSRTTKNNIINFLWRRRSRTCVSAGNRNRQASLPPVYRYTTLLGTTPPAYVLDEPPSHAKWLKDVNFVKVPCLRSVVLPANTYSFVSFYCLIL